MSSTPPVEKTESRINKAIQWLEALNAPIKFYLIGTLVFAVIMAAALIGVANPKSPMSDVFFTTSFSCVGIGFIIETYQWIASRLDKPIAKLIVSISGIMTAAAAYSVSAFTINEATGQNATYFKYSTTFLAPIAFLPLLAVFLMLISLVMLPFFLLWLMGQLASNPKSLSGLDLMVMGCRVVGLLIIASAAQSISEGGPYRDMLTRIAGYSAFLMDMQSDMSCTHNPDDRVLRINDTLVIVGRITDEGPRFARRSCPLTTETQPLPPPEKKARTAR